MNDYLNILEVNEGEELKIKNKQKELNFLKGVRETSIFTNSVKESFENNYNEKVYINTENNLLSVKNGNDKKNQKIFNLRNYERIFKKNREKNLFTLNEEQNAEIIKNIFDIIKTKKIRNKNNINRTIFGNRGKNILTKYEINNTFTNPDVITTITHKNVKNTKKEKLTNLSYEHDYSIQRKTIDPNNLILNNKNKDFLRQENKGKYPYIQSLRNEIINLDKKAKKFNKNITTQLKFSDKEFINDRKQLNITLLKPNQFTMNNLEYYEDEGKKNLIENKKYINHYIKKLNNFKYNNDIINKFFERKKENIEDATEYMPKIRRKIELDDDYYYLRKKPKIMPIPVLKKLI